MPELHACQRQEVGPALGSRAMAPSNGEAAPQRASEGLGGRTICWPGRLPHTFKDINSTLQGLDVGDSQGPALAIDFVRALENGSGMCPVRPKPEPSVRDVAPPCEEQLPPPNCNWALLDLDQDIGATFRTLQVDISARKMRTPMEPKRPADQHAHDSSSHPVQNGIGFEYQQIERRMAGHDEISSLCKQPVTARQPVRVETVFVSPQEDEAGYGVGVARRMDTAPLLLSLPSVNKMSITIMEPTTIVRSRTATAAPEPKGGLRDAPALTGEKQ